MEIPGPPYQAGSNGSSVKRLARERSSWGTSGRRVVVFLGGGVDRVDIVVDTARGATPRRSWSSPRTASPSSPSPGASRRPLARQEPDPVGELVRGEAVPCGGAVSRPGKSLTRCVLTPSCPNRYD